MINELLDMGSWGIRERVSAGRLAGTAWLVTVTGYGRLPE